MPAKIFLSLLLVSLLNAEPMALFFQGNKEISERELYEALDLYKPYAYEFWKEEPLANEQTLPLFVQTLKNFYRSKGFFHTLVEYRVNEDSIDLIIKEETPVRVADITLLSEFDIASMIPFKKSSLFDAEDFEKSKKDIRRFYADLGYCNAQLDAKAWIDIETNQAYLTYQALSYEVCRFGPITVHPPEDIDAEIIRSLLYIKEGDPFAPENISRSYKSLYGNEGISKAIIDTRIQDRDSAAVDVSVTQTDRPIRFQAGIGASSDEGLMVSAGIKHRNLFSDLKTLSLSTRITQIRKTVKSNFDMPIANRNATGAEIGFENEKFLGFKEEHLFGGIFLKQREIPHMFQESLLFDRSITYDSEDTLLFPEGSLFVLSPKLEWNYDTRDNLLDPKEGHFIRAEGMGSLQSKLSDASYHKYKFSGGYIIPLGVSTVALKADYGSLRLYDGEIPPSYRFFAGGMNSNRAYGYRKLGPSNPSSDPIGSDSIFEATAEYRFGIYGDFRGVLFNDNTFIGRSDVPDYDQGYYSAGAGIRYLTPIGPIALDFGFDLEDPASQYAFHFHIGELF